MSENSAVVAKDEITVASEGNYNQDLTDEEVDRLRKSWEITDHWLLRRDFIWTHRHRYPMDRLLCLAQTFVNVTILGNEYDSNIMKQIDELAKDVKSYQQFSRKK
ncbi:partner of xrn-2 protein 1-like [Oppia nitens]|uniref:partner of xrn-2 protein 1-like n=1 Tax=Oppia nitens TaxID=1686743 RepID=UPI0023DC6799|nr:partner of xrn-2 protein 1-like [Oppia nitens]